MRKWFCLGTSFDYCEHGTTKYQFSYCNDFSLMYTVRPISFETVFRKPQKKNPKNSKQILLFEIISINCNVLVGAIFQSMHCLQKISNRNSLQFRCYRCSNVTYGCISVPLHLHFQLRKCKIVGRIQIRRVQRMVKSYAWTTRCSCFFAVNACGPNHVHSFHFFQIIRQNAVNDRTLQCHPTTSTVVVP